jgi:Family of unknown function (DUF5995)
MNDEQTVAAVLARMRQRNDDLPPGLGHRAFFLETYRRTTEAVGKAIDDARFEDPEWVERWDVVFADLFVLPLGVPLSADTASKGIRQGESPHLLVRRAGTQEVLGHTQQHGHITGAHCSGS